MTYEPGTYRRPYRRGDFHLVDTTREGTFWRSPDGVVVRMASGEGQQSGGGGECSADVEKVKGR